MMRQTSIFLIVGICCPLAARAASLASVERAGAAAPLEVQLDDGRAIEAQLDPRTDDQLLWLRLATSRATLRFSFAWRRVAGVSRAGRSLSRAELLREAASAPPLAGGVRFGIAPGPVGEGEIRPPGDGRESALTAGPSADGAFAATEKLLTLRIFARAANWNETVETDGLLVRIQPVLADGSPAAVGGSLQVRLFGRRLRTTGRRPALGELARWGRWTRSEDFGLSGAEFRLPFRTISPDFDPDIAADGVVNVRLSVPGRGVASASAPVRLRRYERLRDQMQLLEGVRFFPEEAVRRP